MTARSSVTFPIPLPSGFLLLIDPANIEDQEKWHNASTARRGWRIDLDGPEADLLTRNEREFMQWEKLPDGVLRIFGKTNQETGILAESKKRLIANNGYTCRLEAGPTDQSILLIEDACRAEYAGRVPTLDAVAVKATATPGRSLGRTATCSIEYAEDGRPSRAIIEFPR
jgi:hypothetical protein